MNKCHPSTWVIIIIMVTIMSLISCPQLHRIVDTNLIYAASLSLFQIWRALRLVVDTGLHFKGKSREWALKTFVDYAWDTSDKVEKEVTRYQSIPGQAVTYILGQLSIMELKEEAEKALGAKFNLRDFHFQVLINLFPLRLCLTLPLMGSFHVRPLLVHCI